MTRTILTFGDSNTHGTPPMRDTGHHPRLDRRWPVVMAEALGCTLIEEGLPGRTACQMIATSPDMHLDGQLGLRMALLSHGPIDDLLLMLGTNDMAVRYGKSPEMVVAGIAGLIRLARDAEVQARHGGFGITLICPPPVLEEGIFVPELWGAHAKSLALPDLLRPLALAWGIGFIDAGAHIRSSPADGVHFDAASHEALGRAVADHLMNG